MNEIINNKLQQKNVLSSHNNFCSQIVPQINVDENYKLVSKIQLINKLLRQSIKNKNELINMSSLKQK